MRQHAFNHSQQLRMGQTTRSQGIYTEDLLMPKGRMTSLCKGSMERHNSVCSEANHVRLPEPLKLVFRKSWRILTPGSIAALEEHRH
jgi:hypothetical protein